MRIVLLMVLLVVSSCAPERRDRPPGRTCEPCGEVCCERGTECFEGACVACEEADCGEPCEGAECDATPCLDDEDCDPGQLCHPTLGCVPEGSEFDCIPASCDAPPPPVCLDANHLRTYGDGDCTTMGCLYAASDAPCADGCRDGACISPAPSDPCEYRAHQAWTLANLAKAVNDDLAAGWRVRAFFAREENNSGSAQANVVWLQRAGTYFAVQNMNPSTLATTVTNEVAANATVHTIAARPHGSSVRPEVVWLEKGGAYKAHHAWTLSDLAKAVNDDLLDGWRVHSFHARPENNSGSAQANVVWLQRAGTYFAVQNMSPVTLAATVNNEVAASATVHTIAARPHGSSVRPEVVWLEKGGAFKAHQEWTLSNLAKAVNDDVAAGWTVRAFFARPENNSGSALANVVWLERGGSYFAVQNMNASTLATTVTSEVAAGARIHTIAARPHGSSVAPEVAWMERCP